MKKVYVFSALLAISAVCFSGCAVTDLVNKLFKSDENVESPADKDTSETASPVVVEEKTEEIKTEPETSETEKKSEEKTEETAVAEPVKEPEVEVVQEPEIPANLAFANQLQELLNKNDIKGAIALFDTMPEELKGDEDLMMLLASLYISDGNYQMAKATAQKVLDINPKNVEALELMTLIARVSGDKASYSKMTSQILAADPYNASANVMLAEDYALSRKYKLALETYKKALVSEPDNEDALYGVALTSYYTNDVKNSKATCEKLLKQNENNASALSLYAKILGEENNYKKATEYIQKALENDPDNYDYYMDLGSYCKHRNQNTAATEAWTKATQIEPDYFLAYAYLAGSFDEMNEIDKALENYKMVIKTNPDYYYAYESAAVLEFLKEDYSAAQKDFAKANSFNSDYSYQLMMAACYFKMKNSFEAKKILTALMKATDRESSEYNMARFFNDPYSKNAESALTQKINKEDNRNKKGKMLFYMGLYYELNGFDEMANEYYSKVANMQAPMFFEYRMAEWRLKK